jgi:diheme cytochrome c
MLERRTLVITAAAVLLLAAVGAGAARADKRPGAPPNATWQAECGACHVAYPPRLLPAGAWRALMAGLERHFGADASLDAAARAEITSFLETYAGRDRGAGPSGRITDGAWFARKHREVPAAVWRSPQVKSAANCTACHPGAERGAFDEHAVQLPR